MNGPLQRRRPMPGRYRDYVTPDDQVESVEDGIARMEAGMPCPQIPPDLDEPRICSTMEDDYQ